MAPPAMGASQVVGLQSTMHTILYWEASWVSTLWSMGPCASTCLGDR